MSVGFQSRERPKDEIFDNFAAQEMGASEKMEQWGWGEGRKETLANKGRYFAKCPQVVPVMTCQFAALQ